MNSEQMKTRTKKFALDIIRLVLDMPTGLAYQVIGKQLIRSGTSVGANYRASCRARSKADFISKMKIVEEEADESGYWLELLEELHLNPEARLSTLLKETKELVAISVSSIKTAQQHLHDTKVFNQQSSINNQQ